jgi:hypothetical protein
MPLALPQFCGEAHPGIHCFFLQILSPYFISKLFEQFILFDLMFFSSWWLQIMLPEAIAIVMAPTDTTRYLFH